MSVHELKTWHVPFQAVWDRKKPYEIRKQDRDFMVGDTLFLLEFDPASQKFSGRRIGARITYMTPGGEWGLPDGLCVLGLRVVEKNGKRRCAS